MGTKTNSTKKDLSLLDKFLLLLYMSYEFVVFCEIEKASTR